jgi:hypothetical protein
MSWPPSEQEWHKIMSDLPAGADPLAFRSAVDWAVQRYQTDDNSDRGRWQRIAKLVRSKAVAALCREIGQLEHWPSDLARESMAQWVKGLDAVTGIADVNVAATAREGERRERLYENLLICCAGPGALPLSDSASGPTNRVMQGLLAQIVPDPPGARGVQSIIRRKTNPPGAIAY